MINEVEARPLRIAVSVGYDSLGNIINKSDVGAYAYGQNGAGPHAVTAAGGNSYQYDADGNMVSGSVLVGGVPSPRTISWTSFNQVKQITQGGHFSTFTFDAAHQRATQVTDRGTTVYVGSAFERVTSSDGSDVQYKFYIFTPAGRSVVRTMNAGTVTTRYLHQDVLGSIVAVTDETGAVAERYAYDPWGKQTALSTLSSQPSTTRGFTDHEMLPDLGLIHMNGRVYDPMLGRFLSADSIVQDASDSQAYNRYSYCSNNPVNAVDPSGHFSFGSLFRKLFAYSNFGPVYAIAPKFFNQYGSAILGIAATIVVGIFTWYLGPEVAAAAGGFVSGFSGSILNGGSIGDAFRNGVIDAAVGAIVSYAGAGLGVVGDAVVSGAANGAAAEAEGGQFRNGFYSGLVSGAGGEAIQLGGGDYYTQLAESAVVGGTASVVGGGKFANGAATGAFEYMATNYGQTGQQLGSLGSAVEGAFGFGSSSGGSASVGSGRDGYVTWGQARTVEYMDGPVPPPDASAPPPSSESEPVPPPLSFAEELAGVWADRAAMDRADPGAAVYASLSQMGQHVADGNGTFQIGLAFSKNYASWNVGIAFDVNGHVGWYDTSGGAAAAGSDPFSAISLQTSNGSNIKDLAGPFLNASVSGGDGVNASVDGFSGQGARGQPVYGGGYSIGVGGGAATTVGGTQTYIHPFW